MLLVHAHPDDESIGTGATMARYAAEGAQVTLVTCTLGELGEILVPALAGLAADRADQLGGYRIGELATAMRALGVSDHRFLGGAGRWRDSGMVGTSGNGDPRALWRAATEPGLFDEALTALVAVVDQVRPQVLITYDENGGYGHPDHVMAHRLAMAAVEQAAWQVRKVYWAAISRSSVQRSLAALDGRDDTPFDRPSGADDVPHCSDDEITAVIDASAWLAAKRAALSAHATQVSVAGDFFALSDNVGRQLSGIEEYRLAVGDDACGADGIESDLFTGLAGL